MRGRPRRTDPEALARRVVTVLRQHARTYPSQEWIPSDGLEHARSAFMTRGELIAATGLKGYEVRVGLDWAVQHRYIRRPERGARGEWILAKKAADLFSPVVAGPPDEAVLPVARIPARHPLEKPRGCSPKPDLPCGSDKGSPISASQEAKSKAAFAFAPDSNSLGDPLSATPGDPPTRDDFAEHMATLSPWNEDCRGYLRSGLSLSYGVLWRHRGGLVIETNKGPLAIFFTPTLREYRQGLGGVKAWYGEVRVRFPTARRVLVVDQPTTAHRIGNTEIWSLGLAVDVARYLREFASADVERYPLAALFCYLLERGAPFDEHRDKLQRGPDEIDVEAEAEAVLERWREWDIERLPKQDIWSLWRNGGRLLRDDQIEWLFA